MAKVLITGGAGYIGSHTAKSLSRSGYEPVVFDNLSTGHRWAVNWGPLIEGDLSDTDLLRNVFAGFDISAVIHFAAHAYIGESMAAPRSYFHNNVTNTFKLLDVMLEVGVKQFVFSSSCAAYGIPETVPIRENQPKLPVNPYGESKLFIERALHWYGEAYGMSSVALRYFNAAGADPEGELGEDHRPEPHLIPLVIEAALGQRPHVEIYGKDYPTPDGTAIRDYVHVTDLAEAHVLALRHLLSGGASVELNLGTGRGHSVMEVVTAAERASGQRIVTRTAGRRLGDPPQLVADPSKAASLLGWKPHSPGLDSIVESAWRWRAVHAGIQCREA
jgi:UDP-glucose-4-epimerase GalE